MAQKTIQGSETLARQIKSRRNELGLTIEESASRAGVGTKTWSRYEAGESICHVIESVSKRGMEKVRPGKAGKASHIKGNSERA